eukprot:4692977-Prorocentrum_lima.AAC.1
MTSSLVGSEMCIRDRGADATSHTSRRHARSRDTTEGCFLARFKSCLLYTSDAADDMQCVDR